ncbi:MAG: pantetheine-phosphate adenylyltransferase [Oscillospiraceae bacterium]|jgi:pantetheine-phosphate adenylyltransferase|nr:pantetheine-phosphate adenylyltransferase [Oscillospiraceae bacterium]
MRLAIFPGSFDPITNGHLDIIRRAAPLFDQLTVVVLVNPDKRAVFPLERRLAFIRETVANLSNVNTAHFEGLLADYARASGARVVVRGLRTEADFLYEFQMAQINRQFNPAMETLCLMTAPQHAFISSGMVRQIAALGGDIAALVPPAIAADVAALCRPRTDQAPNE